MGWGKDNGIRWYRATREKGDETTEENVHGGGRDGGNRNMKQPRKTYIGEGGMARQEHEPPHARDANAHRAPA